jgi:hypothetical protein
MSWGRQWFPPTPLVANLHAESVGLGPEGEFDDASLIRAVGMLDGVRRRLTDRKQNFLSALFTHRERGEAAPHLVAQAL